MKRQLIRRNARRLVFAAIVVAVTIIVTRVYLLACGPFFTDLVTVQAIEPPHVEQYAKGDLGVVRPRFARRYLVQAYRVFSGRPPLAVSSLPARPDPGAVPNNGGKPPLEQWIELSDDMLGTATNGTERIGGYFQFRYVGDNYQNILNCPDDAFANAIRTLAARKDRFGASSPMVRDWTRAQVAVFKNCPGPTPTVDGPQQIAPLVLPDPAPANADALVRADRAYQTAAAHFYGLDYDDAARRFREIAADRNSPWRAYGQYLAARATIRLATVKAASDADRDKYFAAAQDELKRVLADPAASALHESARGLVEFTEARLHAIDRLHSVAKILASAPAVSTKDFEDYRWLMDRLIGDTVDYDYTSVGRRTDMIENDELTDWVLAVQGQGTAAADRALERWRATRTPAWLVATMWRLSPQHPAVAEVLDQSREIDRASPAYSTVAFLRVRLLADLGRRDEARALLATLPGSPEPGFQTETVNLIKAERFRLAQNLDELLTHAPRTTVIPFVDSVPGPDGQARTEVKDYQQPVFDEDAGMTFTRRMPLDRLAVAAMSSILPSRLRVRVAMAAWSRAVLLGRDDAGLRVAPVLRQLAPQTAADVDRYLKAATPAERHLAAVLLLTRTPGLHPDIRGLDDDDSVDDVEPGRTFRHIGGNWWCGFEEPKLEGRWQGVPELINLLYPTRQVPYPSFITESERAANERELAALKAMGPARSYLAAEVLLWARARPKDPEVPEVLALVVEGWRWGCGDDDNWQLAQRAFVTLHSRYPQSEWAQRTKYWYK